ncbi:ankyrin repeat-containing domain protein [Tuber brumale]|nr:ankyrin repeat-containing domain protein [Tuber brumale]
MSLLALPNELLLQISAFLIPPDVNSLLRTNHHLAALLAPVLVPSLFRPHSEKYARRALYAFASRNDRVTVKKLLSMGIRKNIAADMGILHDAVSSRQSVAVVQTLLDCGLNDVVPTRSWSGTALHVAVETGRVDVAEVLLRSGKFDVNALDWQAFTPLHLAVDKANEEMLLRLLKEKDVDPNIANNNSFTPLYFATFRGLEGCVRLLLADERVHVNAPNTNGWTPLHRAVDDADVALVKLFLLDPRVDPNVPYALDGSTPMHLAVRNYQKNKLTVLRLLLDDARVRTDLRDLSDRTPLQLAVHRDDKETVSVLLECHRVDVNLQDGLGNTPLHFAAMGGSFAVIKELLGRLNLDLDLRNVDGNSIRDWKGHRRLAPETEQFLEACLRDRG